jgi:hypothetical protein
MNKENLNRLLDSIYELEGLVHLALAREDIPESLPLLIARKGEELSRHAKKAVCATSGNDAGYKPASETETESQSTTAQEMAPDFECKPETESSPVLEPVPEFDPEPLFEPVQGAEPEPLFQPVEEPEPEAVFKSQMPDSEDVSSFTNGICEPRGRLVFSINDRYRFKRELFNNSDADFNNTLAFVASMEGYDEAEDYFIGELQWDSKRQEVIDFLEILKKYFKS